MFKFNHGVLGLNARNLLYIKELNPRDRINFADSKLKTKHFLSARNIPVPKLVATIKTIDELNKFDFSTIPGSVVLKPNKGSGGDGIMAFKERRGSDFVTVNDRVVTLDEIKSHIADIVGGRFSITNTKDIAFFEQRIQTHKEVAKYTYQGLPDVRIIVYNLIPVMAMLRLPTRESGGRANMAQGALGVGIDIGTGKPTYIARKFKIVDEIPDVGEFDPKFRIPCWDEILLIASRCQQLTNLGYLACDIALDETGPILLELNARAGLKVQIANKAPLRRRLEQIQDITVKTPEKGIRIAKDLFTKKDKRIAQLSSKKIISLEESTELILKNSKEILHTLIDPQKTSSVINKSIVEELKLPISEKNTVKLKLNLQGEKIITISKVEELTDNLEDYDLILGNKEVRNFLIKPILKKSSIPKSAPTTANTNKTFFITDSIDYGQVDHQIYQVHSKIKFLSRLNPINLAEEIEKYQNDTTYNPQFKYKPFTEELISLFQSLKEIKTDDTPLGQIFEEKKEELFNMLKAIEFIGVEDFTHYSNKLFPQPTKAEVKLASEYRKNSKLYKDHSAKKYYSSKEVVKLFQDVLNKYKLSSWKVSLSSKIIADCTVDKRKNFFVKEGVKFSEQRVKKLIAHEIETHILTAENGKKQPYRIFQNGTANYLETQEGLAIYNQELALHIYPHNYFASGSLHSNFIALNNSFVEAVELLRRKGLARKKAQRMVLRAKRGLGDTSIAGGIAKESIYFRGALKIANFVNSGQKLEELYIGKISIDQLPVLKQISSLNKPFILPNWY